MAKIHYWVGSIFWIMIGVYVAIHSCQLGLGHLRHPRSGFVFFLAAVLLIILSIIDLVGKIIEKRKKEEHKAEFPIWLGLRWYKVLLVLGGLSAYAYFYEVAGFFLSTFLLMVFLYKAVEPTKWWIAVGSSLITLSASYAIFKVWLGVPFPKGFLGF